MNVQEIKEADYLSYCESTVISQTDLGTVLLLHVLHEGKEVVLLSTSAGTFAKVVA